MFNPFCINGRWWKLIITNPRNPILINQQGVYTLGVTDSNEDVIYIRDGLTESMFYKVLSHELVHACCSSYDLVYDSDTEELIADFFSSYGCELVSKADNLFNQVLNQIM